MEYKILVTTMVKTLQEFEDLINEYARDGWRVVATSPLGHVIMGRDKLRDSN